MQAKLKSHQETWVLGAVKCTEVQLYTSSCILPAEKAPSHKQTCTALHLPLAHASFSCKTIVLFLNTPLWLVFTPVGQRFSHFPYRPLMDLQMSCESVSCPLLKNIFVNGGLFQAKMPAGREEKNFLLPWSTTLSWSNLSCCKMAVWAQLLGNGNIRDVLFVFVESASWVKWAQWPASEPEFWGETNQALFSSF